MSIDRYQKKINGKWAILGFGSEVAREETPYYVSVNDNQLDCGYFFDTPEEALAFYEEELKIQPKHGGYVGLYNHKVLIKGSSIWGDTVHDLFDHSDELIDCETGEVTSFKDTIGETFVQENNGSWRSQDA